jgi:ketosteroid isomerase-like protein
MNHTNFLVQIRRFLLIFLLLPAPGFLKAQSAKDSVIATVKQFFEAMKNADTAVLKSTLTDNAILQTIKKDGTKTIVGNEDIKAFIDFVGHQKAGDADEQIKIESVNSDGPLATAWTPYQFFYKGKFSHCGINSFQLVRLDAGWKIQYIIDTRKREGCQ